MALPEVPVWGGGKEEAEELKNFIGRRADELLADATRENA